METIKLALDMIEKFHDALEWGEPINFKETLCGAREEHDRLQALAELVPELLGDFWYYRDYDPCGPDLIQCRYCGYCLNARTRDEEFIERHDNDKPDCPAVKARKLLEKS